MILHIYQNIDEPCHSTIVSLIAKYAAYIRTRLKYETEYWPHWTIQSLTFLVYFLNLTVKEANFKGRKTTKNPMQSIRCTDKAVGCNSYTKIKILKPENDSGIKYTLFDIKYTLF